MRKTWSELLLAFHFLTRLPVNVSRSRPGTLACAARFFPLVGLVIGVGAMELHRLLASHLSSQALAAVLLMYLVLITGGLHEDGLADATDGFGGGWSKVQILSIMHDSRIGSFGAIALTSSLLMRFALLSAVPENRLPGTVIAACVLARWTALPLGAFLPYADEKHAGLGAHVAGKVPFSALIWGTTFAVVSLVAILHGAAAAPIAIAVALVALSGLYFKSQIQGVTGDCFGAANQLTEIAIYFAGALH
jgi:adenosylcobinamide-GDP ribazoletransferase